MLLLDADVVAVFGYCLIMRCFKNIRRANYRFMEGKNDKEQRDLLYRNGCKVYRPKNKIIVAAETFMKIMALLLGVFWRICVLKTC